MSVYFYVYVSSHLDSEINSRDTHLAHLKSQHLGCLNKRVVGLKPARTT